jgi:CAAX prenyl protease-like protein
VEEAARGPQKLRNWPAIGYVLPFVAFIGILAIDPLVAVPQPVRFFAVLTLLAVFSRGLLRTRPSRPGLSVLLGIAVFFVWVGPDILFPGYRNSFLFSNSLMGHPTGVTSQVEKHSLLFMVFRVLGSVGTIPIIEELFWRGWMMRWIIDRNFTRISIGTYHPEAFWIVAALFASEHGSYWDVGLLAGAIYNWWAVRTGNLTDCVLAHAVTNGCLAIYVIGWDKWQYWI